jgi:dCTP diphosphatase
MNSSSPNPSVVELTELVRSFAEARDWQQFHTARNLVLALVGEAGELASEFQWINDSEVETALTNPDKRDAIGSELADVFIYLLRLADVTGIDLANELTKKIAINEIRYSVEKSRGSAAKYTSYE